jgi:hypothetical protein
MPNAALGIQWRPANFAILPRRNPSRGELASAIDSPPKAA